MTTSRRWCLGLCLVWCRGARADGFDLAALMARMAAAGERRAAFREVRRFRALEGALESSGTLAWRRSASGGGRMEKVTLFPVQERLEVEGERVVITAGQEAPRVVPLGAAPELRVLLDAVRGPLLGDWAALQRGFVATLGGTLAGWTLDLVPRDPAAARVLGRAHLEGVDDQVLRLLTVMANGDEQDMTIQPR